jgi:hypothetical protein
MHQISSILQPTVKTWLTDKNIFYLLTMNHSAVFTVATAYQAKLVHADENT